MMVLETLRKLSQAVMLLSLLPLSNPNLKKAPATRE